MCIFNNHTAYRSAHKKTERGLNNSFHVLPTDFICDATTLGFLAAWKYQEAGLLTIPPEIFARRVAIRRCSDEIKRLVRLKKNAPLSIEQAEFEEKDLLESVVSQVAQLKKRQQIVLTEKYDLHPLEEAQNPELRVAYRNRRKITDANFAATWECGESNIRKIRSEGIARLKVILGGKQRA